MNHRTLNPFRYPIPLLGLFLHSSLAHAQFVLSPVAVVGTDLGTFDPSASVENLINQSGVTTPFISGTTVFNTYFANPGQVFATSGDGGTNNWTSNFSFTLPVTGYVDFDLGAVYQLNKLALWNRSLKDIRVALRSGINDPEQIVGSFRIGDRQSFSFSYAVDVLPFTGTFTGRYVRLLIDSTHLPFPGSNFAYAIAGEVALSALPVSSNPPEVGIALQKNGGVLLTFTGKLQASDSLSGEFTDVASDPQGAHLITAGSLSGGWVFRSRSE